MKRSVKPIFVSAFLAIYLSYIAFYDLRILEVRGLYNDADLGGSLRLWAMFLSPFLLVMLLNIVVNRENSRFLLIFLLYIAIGSSLGILRGNSEYYIASEILNACIFLSGFGLYRIGRNYYDQLLNMSLVIGGAFVAFRSLFFIYTFESILHSYYGTRMDSLIAFLSLAKLNIAKNSAIIRRSFLGKVYAAFILMAVVIGQKRTVLISIIAFLFHNSASRLMIVGVLVTPFAVTAMIFFDGAFSRIERTFDFEFLVSNQEIRLNEIVTAFSAWISTPLTFLVGHGFGAQILVETGRVQNGELLHSLHNTPMAVAYRSGLLGLSVMAFIVAKALRGFGLRFERSAIVGLFVGSLFFYSFMNEMFVGLFLAKILDHKGRI